MRRVLCCAALVLAAGALMSGSASAQTSTKEPVVDSAPSRVRFLGGGVITGHLEGWVAGDEVSLHRRAGDSWRSVATRPVDDAGKVRFTLQDMRRTQTFRLVFVDPASGVETTSSTRTVKVRARLTLELSPDHVMSGRTVTASGRLTAGRGRHVAIQQRRDGSWRTIGTAYENDGRYAFRFEANRIGSRNIRAVFKGDADNVGVKTRDGLRVYNPARATWYGPGLYGNRTACGQTLRSDTVGVAHRSLPCGAEVAVLYQGRTIMLRVIDRGPYSHADWDLTQRAAERLGFSGSDTIGVDPVN